jgi:hypothetical protein
VRRIRFVHWNQAEAEERAERLRALGYDVDASPAPMPFRRFAEGFDAVVVDLGRLPSQGRDVGVAVRIAKPTRRLPLVFVGGAEDKAARVRETLPDAVFTSWERVGDALRRARPPTDPVVPASALAGYSSTPLPKKLGIGDGTVVALVGAPEGFEALLGVGAAVRRGNRGRRDLTIAFATDPDVGARWQSLAASPQVDDVWIVWAKKGSPRHAGVTQALVRREGLARGFVDFKVCAVDDTWSGLRFKRRR